MYYKYELSVWSRRSECFESGKKLFSWEHRCSLELPINWVTVTKEIYAFTTQIVFYIYFLLVGLLRGSMVLLFSQYR